MGFPLLIASIFLQNYISLTEMQATFIFYTIVESSFMVYIFISLGVYFISYFQDQITNHIFCVFQDQITFSNNKLFTSLYEGRPQEKGGVL